MIKNNIHAKGFTLIEVVTVMVILSILAALGGRFVFESSRSYEATQARARLINTGRQAVESMSRQLRVSLSYSVRITNSNTCLEFMPILAGGNYIDPAPDVANGAAASSVIATSPHAVETGSAQFVSIGAADSSEIYGANNNTGSGAAASRAALLSAITSASGTQLSLTLAANKIWKRNSLGQHFFLLEAPQAFCIVSNQLRWYTGQDVTSAGVTTGGASSLMADNVTAATPFTISTGTESRNTVVSFNITFVKNGESAPLNQTVMIRNVP